MKLLAIDTSTEKASIALLSGSEFLHQEQGASRTHAQVVLPMIDELLAKAGISIKELSGIVFGCGPGSFTGLRIACSIAKGLAYAHDLGLIPVSSLAVIAWSVHQHSEMAKLPVLSVLDARMHEMYWAYFSQAQYTVEEHVNAVADIVIPIRQPIVLAGVGIEEYWPSFSDVIKSQVSRKLTVYPSAIAMIKLALSTQIAPISAADAQPVYIRNQVTYDPKKSS